jgi:hypothetical protein
MKDACLQALAAKMKARSKAAAREQDSKRGSKKRTCDVYVHMCVYACMHVCTHVWKAKQIYMNTYACLTGAYTTTSTLTQQQPNGFCILQHRISR